jgi:hypothetical protein
MLGCHTADSKPVKQEVSGTLILPPLVFPGLTHKSIWLERPVCVKYFNLFQTFVNYAYKKF